MCTNSRAFPGKNPSEEIKIWATSWSFYLAVSFSKFSRASSRSHVVSCQPRSPGCDDGLGAAEGWELAQGRCPL